MKFGVVVFPGSNCDHDCFHVLKDVYGLDTHFLWHKNDSVEGFDCLVLPGGFSYGDYLRTGAIARFSPIMKAVIGFANRGGMVIGICNGFQILLESGLLPGAMKRNRDLSFICKHVNLRVETAATPFTCKTHKGDIITVPVAHGEGNYFADEETLARLEAEDRVVFRYCDDKGETTVQANPNGSVSNIAGICNEKRNVLGMMPHPERCAEPVFESTDGKVVFDSMLSFLGAR